MYLNLLLLFSTRAIGSITITIAQLYKSVPILGRSINHVDILLERNMDAVAYLFAPVVVERALVQDQ